LFYSFFQSNDLDRLFPERVQPKRIVIKRQQSSQDSSSRSSSVIQSPDDPQVGVNDHSSTSSADESIDSSENSTAHDSKVDPNEIKCKQNVWYSTLTNRWLILFGAIIKIVIMFLVQWGYALSALITLIFVWYYIGQVNPGVFPGISEFRFYPWLRKITLRCFGYHFYSC
jgi:potassium/chloride transporter 8